METMDGQRHAYESNAAALVEHARTAICSQREGCHSAVAAIAALEPHASEVSATDAVDLLERACVFGTPRLVDDVWECFDGDFAFTGWALALALRCGREDVARTLLGHGVDLLGQVRRPRKLRALLPHEGAFTRFDLVRESPTLFLNNMDPTVGTEVFEGFSGTEQLAGPAYSAPTDIGRTCDVIARLAGDGLFDATVFDDLFRAAVVKAWHALRHAGSQDPELAETCLGLAARLLELHRERGMGDRTIDLILGNLVVPHASRRVVAFVCEAAPSVFLGRLCALGWLQDDIDLVRAMVPHLSGGMPEQSGTLLRILAAAGAMSELQAVIGWTGATEPQALRAAIDAASEAGHAEAATWLFVQLQGAGAKAGLRASAGGRVPVGARGARPSAQAPEPAPTPTAAPAGAKTAAPLPHAARRMWRGADTVPSGPSIEGDRTSEREDLARRIVELTRGTVVAENPFLASSIGLLRLEPTTAAAGGIPFRTDGRTLSYDIDAVIDGFHAQREPLAHDFVHTLVHCILLHPFVGPTIDRSAWSLAADIVSESLVAEIVGRRGGRRGDSIDAVLDHLADDLGPTMTTERLYHALVRGGYASMRAPWASLFHVDDHDPWYPTASEGNPATGRPRASEGGPSSHGAGQGGETRSGGEAAGDQQKSCRPEGGGDGSGSDRVEGGQRDGGQTGDGNTGPSMNGAEQAGAARAEAERRWEQAAKSLRVDLETLSRKRGERLQRLMHELEVSPHERVDYREFLRQFAVQSEEMRLSDDEFDYVFYTYGLALYGDLPLIEPLEYRNERRIRDFAIVIDTSSSVSGKVVQQFVDTTFDVLTSESSFFQKVNIHIIQADLRVQSDTKITSLAELDRWRRNIRLYGLGGTDFRPAFRYVGELLSDGEFDDLSGLIYFTDGWGIYPERMPPYKTTFVFYDEDHRPELVPAWALQITLHPGEFESMSVY